MKFAALTWQLPVPLGRDNRNDSISDASLQSTHLSFPLFIMPHAVFGIDELLRLVIDEIVETSPSTAVSFALTCRSFEEPTLRSLWKLQDSLITLVKVLPDHTWVRWDTLVSGRDFPVYCVRHRSTQAIEYDPSAKDWLRLQRYASWMRELSLACDWYTTAGTLRRLSSHSPDGILCPKLERLDWDIGQMDSVLPFFHLFLSRHLKEVTLHTSVYLSHAPSGLSAALVQIIPFLSTSLEAVHFKCHHAKDKPLTDAISSFICRCGSPLRSLGTWLPLSEVATRHIVQLPNLRSWAVAHGPPQTVPTSIFPSLEQLQINEPAAMPWLHLLASHKKGVLQNGSASATSYANIRERLKSISFPGSTIVDPTLLSSIVTFRNLVALCVGGYCPDEGCVFRLTDDDMENLAAALPRLETLKLGEPCYFNSCSNTVASLLSISIHCLDLTILETHFNTGTITSDMQRLLDRGAGRDKAKCKLSELITGYFPNELPGEDIETVMMGFKAIFPHLEIAGSDGRSFKVECGPRD